MVNPLSGNLENSDWTGMAGALGISIGSAVSENLILAGRLFVISTPNPTVSFSSVSGNTSKTTLSTVGLGPELAYYIMPINVYLSATLALTRQMLEYDDMSGSSDMGFGAQFGLGKQWWVGEHWSLGIGGQFTYASNPDSGETLNNWSVAGLFSVSMN
jgi:hypothetical protein